MYEKQFNLNEHPYRNVPDPRFLWYSEQHLGAKDKILYYINQSMGPIILIADIGLGKTLLANRIYDELKQDKMRQVVSLFSPKLTTTNAFLRFVMEEFNVKTERNYADSLRNFERFLVEQYKKGISPVLLIDEAQVMTRDMLLLIQHLYNFSTDKSFLIQIAMFSQPEIKGKIKRLPSLKSRLTPARLSPFDRKQTEDMLKFRWQVSGGKSFPFTKEALDEIQLRTEGVPRYIIKYANEALLNAAIEQKTKVVKQNVLNVVSEIILD